MSNGKYKKNILKKDLTDLHIHVGGAMSPQTLWEIAHSQGIKLPVKDFWDFNKMVANPSSIKDYFRMYELNEKIQSSPKAMERGVYNVISKEYRSSNVSKIELRFNPMFRTKGAEIDMDHIIHAAIRGMERAILDYNVEAGIIFSLDRRLNYSLNEIIVDKAIKYSKRGVVGLDIAGPEDMQFVKGNDYETYKKIFKENVGIEVTNPKYLSFEDGKYFDMYSALFKKAKSHGLGITVHTGEMKNSGGDKLIKVVKAIQPDRIGHGIKAAFNPEALELLKKHDIVLEICPTSNIVNKTVENWGEMKRIIKSFLKNGIRFTINTDAPYILKTGLAKEYRMLQEKGILNKKELDWCLNNSNESTFI